MKGWTWKRWTVACALLTLLAVGVGIAGPVRHAMHPTGGSVAVADTVSPSAAMGPDWQ
ncbi:MAG: hypothetical protein IRZ10_02030 [Thermoflavifilum sp.]|nr:hypothetical protein [Thermoflavifilum sp.]MCL6513170.1 hypothetical protein [Alicyclobacillus sp.]